MNHRVLFLPLHALLGPILVIWGGRDRRRRSRSGASVFLAPEEGEAAAAYEQECDNGDDDADEESFVLRHPAAYCGATVGVTGAGGLGGRGGGYGGGAGGDEVVGVGHGDLLVGGTAGVGCLDVDGAWVVVAVGGREWDAAGHHVGDATPAPDAVDDIP